MKLIRNQIKTPDGTVLRSYHVHDFKGYLDKNGKTYMIDGGLDYCRRSANGDEVDECLYSDEPHEVQRQAIVWGTYGKNGDEELKRVTVADMETEHIQAVLKECNPSSQIKECMEEELKQR